MSLSLSHSLSLSLFLSLSLTHPRAHGDTLVAHTYLHTWTDFSLIQYFLRWNLPNPKISSFSKCVAHTGPTSDCMSSKMREVQKSHTLEVPPGINSELSSRGHTKPLLTEVQTVIDTFGTRKRQSYFWRNKTLKLFRFSLFSCEKGIYVTHKEENDRCSNKKKRKVK